MKKYPLTIELIPATSMYDNVRSRVSKKTWDLIRRSSYQKANYVCEVCGDNGKNQGYKHPVECHEIWEYNENTGIQKLVGFISLCPICHKVKHAGLSIMKGWSEIVIKQLMKVNNISELEAINIINNAAKLWEKRSKMKWEIDINYLTDDAIISRQLKLL